LAAKILTRYKQKIRGLTLVPAGGGCFELSVNGKLIYSKLAEGEFPNEAEMVELVGKQG